MSGVVVGEMVSGCQQRLLFELCNFVKETVAGVLATTVSGGKIGTRMRCGWASLSSSVVVCQLELRPVLSSLVPVRYQ